MKNRVLAAEDSPTQAVLLRSHLEEAGFVVSMAANGAEALALLASGGFDIVVSDVVMPEVDGYELCQAVKERDPQLPVVLLTSLGDPLDVVRALSAGADNFLRKPYQPDELIHRIRHMVQNKELREAGRAQMGLELFFLGRRFMINAEREQILDLLVSTFEDLVAVNRDLQVREEQLAVAHQDVTARLAEAELQRDRLHAVLAALPEGMLVVDQSGVVIDANQNLADLLGVPMSSLRGRVAWEVVRLVDHAGEPLGAERRCLHKSLRGEQTPAMGTAFDLFVERADGTRFPALGRTAPILSSAGAVVGAVGILEDIAALSGHDPVTGLPGHGILVDRLQGATDVASEHGSRTGLLVVTIDRFERIREGLPSGGGDRVVAAVAECLGAVLRRDEVRQRSATASAAYLGNGEVAVLLPGVHDEADVIVVGEVVAEHLELSVDADGVEVTVTASVAVGMVDADTDPARLVSAVAAAARRLSGAGGGGVVASNPSLRAEVVQRLQRENELRAAIADGGIVAHYQPEIDLDDGAAVAMEALVRWEHPVHGLLGAGDIIPLAVESGLIGPLGWAVLEQSCRQVAHWREALVDGDRLTLSVNVAAEQLCEPDVAERVERILVRTGFDPAALILEITEGSVMDGSGVIAERLDAIKALGVRLAIDDFGTGYSSLLQLRQLPVDILKVDRTFVAGMVDREADAAIVTATLGLARALGLQVVAEGVETPEQLAALRAQGCDLGQGYLWAKPMAGEDLERWWSHWAEADRSGFDGGALRSYRRRAGDQRWDLLGGPPGRTVWREHPPFRTEQVVASFVQRAEGHLRDLGDGIEGEPDEAWAALALGGASFGAHVLADLALELHELAEENSLPSGPDLVARVRAILRDAADSLEEGPALR